MSERIAPELLLQQRLNKRREDTGMTRRVRARSIQTKPIGEVLGTFLAHRKLYDKVKRYEFLSSWKTIVGEQIAAVASPERIMEDGVLVIGVASPSWMQDLALRKSQILSLIRNASGGQTINDIRLVASFGSSRRSRAR